MSGPAGEPARELDIGRAALAGAFASALVGLYALATAGPVGPMPLIVLAAAIVVGGFRMRKGVDIARTAEGGTIRTGLPTFLIALVVIPLHGLITGSPVLAAIDLLVILQANRLVALSEGRAVGQVLLLALLMLMGAAVVTLNISFLGAVFLFCIAGTWTAVFLSLLDPHASGADRRVPRRFAFLAAGSGLAIFALTGVFFGVLPRLRFQAFQSGLLQTEGVSGFAEEVTLGDIGSVKQDFSPVMRVALSGAPVDPTRLYWRGIALDRYRASHWSVSDPAESRLSAIPRRGANYYEVTRNPAKGPAVIQKITLEALDVPVLFGLSDVQRVAADLPFLSRNSTDSMVFRANSYSRTRYTIESSVRSTDAGLAGAKVPEGDGDPSRYLQIPPDLKAELLPLASQLAGEGSDLVKARRIERAMQSWNYSLSTQAASRRDPVSAFCLETRTGWCEQFSSGMVLMLRAIGIPARMTNGFHGGESNEYGGYLLVRKSDAHSWVEVPFGENSWVTFDPTPGGRSATVPRSFNRLRQIWDYARLVWSQRIVTYNIFDQFSLVSAAGDRAQNFSETLSRSIHQLQWKRLLRRELAGLLLALAVAWMGWRWWTGRVRASRANPAREAETWWREVERLLGSRGYVRRRGETPRELAVRAGVPSWAELYYAVRFSLRAPHPDERAEMERIRREARSGA